MCVCTICNTCTLYTCVYAHSCCTPVFMPTLLVQYRSHLLYNCVLPTPLVQYRSHLLYNCVHANSACSVSLTRIVQLCSCQLCLFSIAHTYCTTVFCQLRLFSIAHTYCTTVFMPTLLVQYRSHLLYNFVHASSACSVSLTPIVQLCSCQLRLFSIAHTYCTTVFMPTLLVQYCSHLLYNCVHANSACSVSLTPIVQLCSCQLCLFSIAHTYCTTVFMPTLLVQYRSHLLYTCVLPTPLVQYRSHLLYNCVHANSACSVSLTPIVQLCSCQLRLFSIAHTYCTTVFMPTLLVQYRSHLLYSCVHANSACSVSLTLIVQLCSCQLCLFSIAHTYCTPVFMPTLLVQYRSHLLYNCVHANSACSVSLTPIVQLCSCQLCLFSIAHTYCTTVFMPTLLVQYRSHLLYNCVHANSACSVSLTPIVQLCSCQLCLFSIAHTYCTTVFMPTLLVQYRSHLLYNCVHANSACSVSLTPIVQLCSCQLCLFSIAHTYCTTVFMPTLLVQYRSHLLYNCVHANSACSVSLTPIVHLCSCQLCLFSIVHTYCTPVFMPTLLVQYRSHLLYTVFMPTLLVQYRSHLLYTCVHANSACSVSLTPIVQLCSCQLCLFSIAHTYCTPVFMPTLLVQYRSHLLYNCVHANSACSVSLTLIVQLCSCQLCLFSIAHTYCTTVFMPTLLVQHRSHLLYTCVHANSACSVSLILIVQLCSCQLCLFSIAHTYCTTVFMPTLLVQYRSHLLYNCVHANSACSASLTPIVHLRSCQLCLFSIAHTYCTTVFMPTLLVQHHSHLFYNCVHANSAVQYRSHLLYNCVHANSACSTSLTLIVQLCSCQLCLFNIAHPYCTTVFMPTLLVQYRSHLLYNCVQYRSHLLYNCVHANSACSTSYPYCTTVFSIAHTYCTTVFMPTLLVQHRSHLLYNCVHANSACSVSLTPIVQLCSCQLCLFSIAHTYCTPVFMPTLLVQYRSHLLYTCVHANSACSVSLTLIVQLCSCQLCLFSIAHTYCTTVFMPTLLDQYRSHLLYNCVYANSACSVSLTPIVQLCSCQLCLFSIAHTYYTTVFMSTLLVQYRSQLLYTCVHANPFLQSNCTGTLK